MELDPRWPRLLAAGRAWRATLIPGTSSGIYGPTKALLAAIESFDTEADGGMADVIPPQVTALESSGPGEPGDERSNMQEGSSGAGGDT